MFWTFNTKAQKRPKKQFSYLVLPSLHPSGRALALKSWSRSTVALTAAFPEGGVKPQGSESCELELTDCTVKEILLERAGEGAF